MTEEVNDTETLEDGSAPLPEATELSISDIGTIVSIIEICSKRGAFQGGELEAIGGVRNRVVAFLQSVEQTPPEEGEGAEQPAADPEGREQPEAEA